MPGDTFDINLQAYINTHPTIGPLFGRFKVQLDLFQCPIRLYQGQLHNNKLGIGMKMSNVKLPIIQLTVPQINTGVAIPDIDNLQINPSCLLSYLGIRGVAYNPTNQVTRDFNAVPLLAYWDIYKNYYSNKQEELGAVIHRKKLTPFNNVSQIVATGPTGTDNLIPRPPAAPDPYQVVSTTSIKVVLIFTETIIHPEEILLHTNKGTFPILSLFPNYLS